MQSRDSSQVTFGILKQRKNRIHLLTDSTILPGPHKHHPLELATASSKNFFAIASEGVRMSNATKFGALLGIGGQFTRVAAGG